MSKKNDGNIVIGESIIEKLFNLCEKGMNDMNERESNKKIVKEHEIEFIKAELKRVEDEMKNTNILDDKYIKLINVYNALFNVIRWW